jgi:hypothetical protein
MIHQVQMPMGALPVNLILIGNASQGAVAFIRSAITKTVFDQGEVSARIDEDGILLHTGQEMLDINYNTIYEYKQIPLLLKWLQQQNMQEPLVFFE